MEEGSVNTSPTPIPGHETKTIETDHEAEDKAEDETDPQEGDEVEN